MKRVAQPFECGVSGALFVSSARFGSSGDKLSIVPPPATWKGGVTDAVGVGSCAACQPIFISAALITIMAVMRKRTFASRFV